MGIAARVAALQRAAISAERADALGKAAARLVDAAGMGREYKVMGVTGRPGRGDAEAEVWPFVAGEVVVQDAASGRDAEKSSVGCPGTSGT
jgi:hypothetical protein